MSALNGSKVLVLYDGSSMADRALDAALERAAKKKERITLLTAIPARLWRAKQGQFPTSLDEHDEEFARRMLARGHERCEKAGVGCDELLLTGSVVDSVVEESAKGYEALYVGERRSPVSRPSLSSQLQARAACDVVAVP